MINEINNITSSPEFFEAKYKECPDPWNFATDAYELRRYDAIVAAISHRRYRYAFEPGCSIGILTKRLAKYCDAVHAVDFSPSATAQASQRCANLLNVEIRCASLSDPLPKKSFDLLMLSEIGYYFSAEDWRQIASTLIDSLPSGATILAAHWLGKSDDHLISGDEVHEILIQHPALRVEYAELHRAMRLDRLVRL